MKRTSVELIVGLFVLAGILCVGYLTIKLGKLEWFGDDSYPIYASFRSVSGLKVGAHVEMAGVQVGKVDQIELDRERQVASIRLRIQKQIVLTDDVIASVKTAGLIGDKYIKLSPGGSETVLKAGGKITETESALDIEELVSKYVFGNV
jgi:phospholipid/cholesterol/gamma-HCH transport system substrate-binding protein